MPIKIVFWPPLEAEWMAKVKALGVDAFAAQTEEEVLREAGDAVAFCGNPTPAILSAATQLRWIQAQNIGLDNFFFPELRESSVTVTNVRGIYSDVIADHVFALLLSFARGLHHYVRRQQEGRWAKSGEVIHVAGTTLGVIGLGGIGLAVAERGRVFRMRILGLDPAPKDRPDYVEAVYAVDRLHEMLAQVDFLAICVPHTSLTAHMIDAAALKVMKPGAILINIGRGKVVDLKALTEALEAGALGGAGLDVFEEEPLPEGHPLWAMENVVITPHVAGSSPRIIPRRMDLIVENVRRFCEGEPLLNLVDKEAGYVVEVNPEGDAHIDW